MMSAHQQRRIKNLCDNLGVRVAYSPRSQTYIFSLPEPSIDNDMSEWMDYAFSDSEGKLCITGELIEYWGYERFRRVLWKFKGGVGP